jgi:oligopeptide/dipeptide ABC transporter ATP-binding protein
VDHPQPLLSVRNLKTYFHTLEGVAKAVDDVSFNLMGGETMGLVGESGCGKSVSALSIMRLVPEPPGKIVGGQITLEDKELLKLSQSEMRAIRGNRISMIFQEPMTSLNPVYTIGQQIAEVFENHQSMDHKEALDRTIEMLAKVQIPSPEKRVHEYPYQLSGGMRQRVMIAMALACEPQVLVADEPTTALDVTIQAQIIDLMLELKQDFQAAILMITHDLGVIAEMADWVVVMYAGRVVEEGSTLELFENPLHPYTAGLLNSVPVIGRRAKHGRQRLQEITGVVPSLYELPRGCTFHPRCPHKSEVCLRDYPEMLQVNKNHRVGCWLHGELSGAKAMGAAS